MHVCIHPYSWVVGLDFSGNPTLSGFAEYRDIFAEAARKGLPFSIHAGECQHNQRYPDTQPETAYQDNEDVLDCVLSLDLASQAKEEQVQTRAEAQTRPMARLGHMILLTDAQWNRLKVHDHDRMPIPIEVS